MNEQELCCARMSKKICAAKQILAIESSCDETAAAVVADGRRLLSSAVASQIDAHQRFGGVVPEIASRMHTEAIALVVTQAMEEADIDYSDLDAVAVTAAPGLIGALLVGLNFAKGLCMATGLPLVPVHHLRAHVAANYLTYPDLEPPFIALIASGGHSHIVRVSDYTHFQVLALTRDDAAGEAMDKIARALGLPYPGGLHMDRAATGDRGAYKFPRPRLSGDTLDFSFSGLKTAGLNLLNNCKQKGVTVNTQDFCASYRESVCAYLADHAMAAAEKYSANEPLVLAGGVCANSRLREMMTERCTAAGIELFLPELALCGDNGAMIGAQGYYEFLAGNIAGLDCNARASSGI
ncbi:MAG: tRNA (adenosine(37)-N6)-threonylcarbamoyltransferase complex transferase subunit TsaD [Oscillospiraceae bacterium]|nr:tRNA (adenosine(37)-N6)-threonylcarbamoyltransferase complex transferase subunit TsaD [Oscillospiraceae bacterium]